MFGRRAAGRESTQRVRCPPALPFLDTTCSFFAFSLQLREGLLRALLNRGCDGRGQGGDAHAVWHVGSEAGRHVPRGGRRARRRRQAAAAARELGQLLQEGVSRMHRGACEGDLDAWIGGVSLADAARLLVRGTAEHDDNDLRRRALLLRRWQLPSQVRVRGLREGPLGDLVERLREKRRVLRVHVLHALDLAVELLLHDGEHRLVAEEIARAHVGAALLEHQGHQPLLLRRGPRCAE
mmetsp:Transcript_15804/g.40723  ORF Transcript_15804/g.40723 Transcript_15804/m.40723 type:complete len:238 (+) Transcript_15804:198-911(+)